MDRSKISEELKRYAPAKLKVTLRDGTDQPVAVPKSGNRWSRTQQVLDSLAWVTIACLDKDGSLLKLIEDDEELDALAEDDSDNAHIAKLFLEVMRGTMKEVRQMFEAQMRAMTSTMSAMAEGQNALVDTYRQALVVQQQHMALPAGDKNDMAEMMQMFQMASSLMAQKKAGG